VSHWPSTKVKKVLSALSRRIGWIPTPKKKGSSHIQLVRPTKGEYTWAFKDSDEIGPKMLSKIAKHTALTREYL
jgi:predicted RNA binding protein YcfA (HicA-like mRNA interferase family)